MPRIAIVNAEANYNLDVLLDAFQSKNLKDGQLTLVATAAPEALKRAEKAKIETLKYSDDQAALSAALKDNEPDLVVVLDRPHHLNNEVLEPFPEQVIALHPALPGQFPAADAVQAAYEAYRQGEIKWSGCNIHYVEPEGKAGKVMRQIVVPVEVKDTPKRFEERMRMNEQWLLLKAVKQFLYELRIHRQTSTSQDAND